MELGYKGTLETTVNKPGTVTLPARKTYDILRELPAGVEVQLVLEQEGWVRLTAGTATFRIPCLPAEEYPALPAVETAAYTPVAAAVLEEMIRKTVFATSHDETRYTLSGVLLVCEGETATMVATDGHRLAHVTRPLAMGKALRVIVPRKALEEVSRFADGEAEVELAQLDNHLVFRRGQALLVTRLIDGHFPDYESVIPKEFARQLTVPHEHLLRGPLRRVSLLANEKTKPVRLELAPEELTLRSNTPELGEAMERIPAAYSGDAMTIGFNARYLLEALAVMDGEEVLLQLNDPLSPGILRSPDDPGFFYVVMPMRV
ncbi:MAG: DNA polymerase III subunit beta [Candidatus Tectimicrobiota bacterium]|nr:MAG: DNA polymerase III subunit beta [Candidatus Tectomicrobia bacterium]